jgi:hypothetical protein
MNSTATTTRPVHTDEETTGHDVAPDQAATPGTPPLRVRWPWLGLWALLTAATAFELVKHGFVDGGALEAILLTSAAVGFFIAPDLTFLVGIGQPVEKGNLARRAVPWYNAMHRMWVPFTLTSVIGLALAPLALVPLAAFIGGLAWMAHIALDRAAGYGLRNPDGSRDLT